MTTDTMAKTSRGQISPGEPRVSVIILNYNTCDDLRTCLRSVQQTKAGIDQDAIETFVVDNASTDGSADMVAGEFPWVTLIRAARNGGYAYGNNLALRESRGRYVMLLNPDALIPPGAIDALCDYLDAHPRAAVGWSPSTSRRWQSRSRMPTQLPDAGGVQLSDAGAEQAIPE